MAMFGNKPPSTDPVARSRVAIEGDAADYFGRKAKDSITGFEGIITGHVRYISGCSQVLITPPVDGDGKKRDGEFFDEQRIEILDAPKIRLDNGRTPGCDMAAPKR